MKKNALNFRTWCAHIGTIKMRECAESTGASLAYFRRLRYGIQGSRPSGQLAMKIVAWAMTETPGFAPDLSLLLEGVPKSGKGSSASLPMPPSAAFERAQRRAAKAAQ